MQLMLQVVEEVVVVVVVVVVVLLLILLLTSLSVSVVPFSLLPPPRPRLRPMADAWRAGA